MPGNLRTGVTSSDKILTEHYCDSVDAEQYDLFIRGNQKMD